MSVNSLPKTVTRQRRDCDLNLGPTAPESSTLTTRLPSQYPRGIIIRQQVAAVLTAKGRIAIAPWRISLTISTASVSCIPQSAPSRELFGRPSYTWFLHVCKHQGPNYTSISSVSLAPLTVLSNKYTHRPRYEGNNRPHLMLRIAMRPINNNNNNNRRIGVGLRLGLTLRAT